MCMKNYNTEKVIFDKLTSFFNIAISWPLLIMIGSAYFHYFVRSTPPMAFSVSFKFFVDLFQIYLNYFRCA